MNTETVKRRLPLSPHPDYLRKQAKARLAEMKLGVPAARLADAQTLLAREYGFASWGHLIAEVMARGEGPRSRAAAVRRWRLRTVPDLHRDEEAHAALFCVGAAAQVGFFLTAFAGVVMVLAASHPPLLAQLIRAI